MKKVLPIISAVFVLFLLSFVAWGSVKNWPFTTSTNYTYDSSQIEFSSGAAKLIQVDQIDSDNTSSGFGGGTNGNTTWSTDHLELSTGKTTGSFESRVMDSLGSVTWETISWTPAAPYYKELPGSAQSESGYSTGNADMTGNVLLMHMNDSSTSIADSSGSSNTGTYNGALNLQTGKLSKAIGFDGSDDVVSISNNSNLDFTGEYTLSGWVYPETALSATNPYMMIICRGGLNSDDIEVYMRTDGLVILHNRNNGGTISHVNKWDNPTVGRWNHFVVTWKNNVWQLFLDGELKQTSTAMLDPKDTNKGWLIGNVNHGAFGSYGHFDGLIDEAAIFNRALSSAEVLSFFNRGVLRQKYQVRSGSANPPTGDFVGPDGTTSSFYSELDSNNSGLTPPSDISLSNVSDNRYFQYKAYLDRDDSSYNTELSSVSIGPNHYSPNDPTILPMTTDYQGFQTIASVSEEATKNGGEIKYVLSNDQGSSWLWYNSSNTTWETSVGTYAQANATAEINSNIIEFPLGSGKFLFKAFLHSDGTQAVELDNFSVQYFLNTPEVVSLAPVSGAINVGADSPVSVVFSHTMNQSTVENAISVSAILDNNDLTTSESVSGTFTWPNVRTASFEPSSLLKKGYTYQVTVSTEAESVGGYQIASAESFSFRTVFDKSKSNTYKSSDEKVEVEIAADALGEDGYIEIDRDPSSGSIDTANSKETGRGDPYHYVLSDSVTEIDAYDSDGTKITSLFNAPVTLTMYYTDSNGDGYVDGTNPPVKAVDLLIYYLDETNNLWVRVPGSSVDTSNKYLSARTLHFSIYSLMANASTDLVNAYAYPVPFKPSLGHSTITFTNLASQCTIRIFTLRGDLVAALNETDGDGKYEWDVKNQDGITLASGVYLFHIESGVNTKSGKLMVVR
ncbi:MAG: Ig-like domain-containing protein [Candidatus Saganbacteria bacterium]|nr:Ig-like domain-containing protein [Candidatus Saganbacteria bacterium]